ncbi:MAG TPA: hypothetical protein PKX87_03625 [Alphaproteobacteria bacterium]|nr:hypothetical protein [Alphaproteobacteria bacterium]
MKRFFQNDLTKKFALVTALLVGQAAEADPLSFSIPSDAARSVSVQPKVIEAFQWASVWPTQLSEEKDESNASFSIYLFEDLITEIRLKHYGLQKRMRDVKGSCLSLGSGMDLTEKSGHAQTFIHLTPHQKFLLSLLEEAQRSPMAKEFLKALQTKSLLVCATQDNFGQAGSYSAVTRVLDVKVKDVLTGLDLTVEEGQSVDKESYYFLAALRAFLEELSHSAQDNVFDAFYPDNYKNRWAADNKLWGLALEAQAKVWASFMFVEIEGDKLATQKNLSIAEPVQGTPDEEILKSVRRTINEHGIDHIKANPQLLLDSFMMFFKSKDFMEAYGELNASALNRLQSLERVPEEEFMKTFGRFQGTEIGIFDGGVPEHPNKSSREKMRRAIPPGTYIGKWFSAQEKALGKGKAGPPIKVWGWPR